MYEISLLRSEDGTVLASCPELGLSCVGDDEDEALDELQSLIFFHTVVMPVGTLETKPETSVTDKILFVPPDDPVH